MVSDSLLCSSDLLARGAARPALPLLAAVRLAGRAAVLSAALALSGCVVPAAYPTDTGASGAMRQEVLTSNGKPLAPNDPILGAAARMTPVVSRFCRERLRKGNCNFLVAVDEDRSQPANAFQTVDDRGRPVIVFTRSLLNMAKNPDELAFVLGHEAAHHIAGHIPRRQDQAMTGAILVGILGQSAGLTGEELKRAQEIGAGLAAQHYSKEFELEADAFGAEIALAAGYDPIRGANFFTRLPDPGNRVMGSHPANAERLAVVRATVKRLGGG
ncbi:M48 family metalloprotease [Pseudogemmobacter bohemicus]|uniref:M48 family metalloprotease n=1 Tax=Pseudogemmobacter bohemicus TaxID=2250708 RepID=UPI000DD4746C|nr:M48 family metalloprotease [Pseudogemmobacter bohemicus]